MFLRMHSINKSNENLTVLQPGTLPNNTVITATHQQNEKIVEVTRPLPTNPPPLAPLSSSIIKPAVVQTKIEEIDSGIVPSHIIKKGDKMIKIDATDINSNNGSQKVNANKMLADLLEKKSDPPNMFDTPTGKRKIDNVIDANESQPPAKRLENGELSPPDLKTNGEEKTKKAADLYAELAGSILEDEDLDEMPVVAQKQPVVEQKLLVTTPKPPPATTPHKQVIMPMPVQRQLILSPNNPGQVILQSTPTQQQPPQQQIATIKTDSGIQSVPIILQHPSGQNIQIQKQMNSAGQIVGQPTLISTPSNQHGQTQYILATNPQGQTYLVAQPNPHHGHPHQQPQQQTVLLAQQPQQHGPAKQTIIILQQPGNQVVGNQGGPQKMIMTTPQGQQLLVTQTPRQQILMNHTGSQPNATSGNVICAQTQSGQKIFITRQDDKQLIIQKEPGATTGQIMIQQTPGGGQQQFINLVQQGGQQNQIQITPQQLQSGQIVLQGGQQQLQQNPMHQIVIQKQPAPTQLQQGQVIIQKTPSNVQQVIQQQQQQPPSQPQVTVTQTTVATQQQAAATPPPPNQIQVQIKTVPQQQPVTTQSHSVNSNLNSNPSTHNQNQSIREGSSKGHKETDKSMLTNNSNDSEIKTHSAASPLNSSTTATTTSTQSTSVTTGTSAPVTPTTDSSTPSAPNSPATTAIPSIPGQGSHMIKMIPAMDPSKIVEEDVESSWLWVCDWRGCPK